MSTCRFLGSLLRDDVHPSELGQLFVADVLTHHFAQAEVAARGSAARGVAAKAASAPPAGLHTTLRPAQPYHDGSWAPHHTKCYEAPQP